MSFKRSVPWTRQPQTPVGIAQGWRGSVIQAHTCASGHESVSNRPWNRYGTPIFGAGDITFNTNAAGLYIPMPGYAKTDSYTVLFLVKRLGAGTAYAGYIGASAHGNDTAPYGDQIDSGGSTGADLRFAYNAGGAAAALTVVGAGISTTDYEWVAATFTPGSQKLYKNSALIGSSASAGTPTWFSDSTLNLGALDNLARNPNISVRFAARFNRAFELPEIIAIQRNPWQIFEPLKRNIYVEAAASDVSGTISTTMAGFLSSISGTTTILGSLNQTLVPFPSNMSGTTSILGNMAVTLDNNISNMSGTTTIRGTISTVLGVITSAIQGTTTILGTITTTLGDAIAAFSESTLVVRLRALLGVGS